MTKILFVCMGNICRSPTAHAVMQHLINERGLSDQIQVDSAGTHAYHIGEKSDARSRAKAAEKGVDMSFVRARKLATTDYQEFDYILAMDTDNLALIHRAAPDSGRSAVRANISLFLDFANRAGTTQRHEVPDPYYGAADGFEDVFDLVSLGCDAILKSVLQDPASQPRGAS